MRVQRLVALLVFVALFSVACQASTTVDAPDAATDRQAQPVETAGEAPSPPDEQPPSPGEESEPEAAGEPELAVEPATEPDRSEDGDVAERFTGTAPSPGETPAAWQEPFPLDPAVTSGTLANGMEYLIHRNGRPGGQAQLRLVVEVGSVDEDPADAGIAHFLEHMMFNGTEDFPRNEIVRVLESFGSTFGPDINAYTSFDETVYELELPSDVESLRQGFDVLFQWAGRATLESADVIGERGVVREEMRRSLEPLSGRIGAQVRSVIFAGTPYLGMEPIGQPDVVENMSAAQLEAFYERWYRPDLMTLVAVGDFNPSTIEQLIIETFVDPAATEPLERGEVESAGPLPEPVFETITDAEIERTEVEIIWRLGDELPSTTPAGVRSDFVTSIALSLLSDRLFEGVQSGNSLIGASANGNDFTPGSQIVSMSGQVAVDEVEDALVVMLTEIEQARQYGFTQVELDRVLSAIGAGVEQSYAARNTRQDDDIAAELVGYALGSTVLVDPDEERQALSAILESITLADLQRILFDVLETDPYVLVTAPASDEALIPTPEELSDRYYSVVGMTVEPRGQESSDLTELIAPMEPVAIIDERRISQLDATVVTYENGAQLAYKTTNISENVVIFGGSSLGGFFAVDGPEVPLLQRTSRLVGGSGYETIDIIELEQYLSGVIANAGTAVSRSEETVGGESSTTDIETLFQLVHLEMTEPIISDLRLRQFTEQWGPVVANPAVRPTVAADLELWRLRYGDSPWFRFIPNQADLDGLDPDLQLDAYRERFANAGDFIFVVVGDFDEAELRDLGARYLGTLPDDGVREQGIDRDPGVPEENLQATVKAGLGDQGQVRINWESPYPFTLEADVTAQVLEVIVDARLRDLIREELSASYSPRATVSVLAEPKSWVDSIIEVESDPDRVEEVSQVVREELDRIRAGDIDEQYLELAVEQLTEDYRFFTNRQWIGLITFHIRYPERDAGEFRDRTAIAESLTLDDIVDAANVVFPASRSVEIWLLPGE